MFDEADLDAALARFDELHPQAPRLENAASQLVQRFRTYFAARNWAAVAENSADEIFTDDRRSVVSSGILHGRDIDVANIRAIADLGATDLTSTVIATRGERLVLTRLRLSGRDQRPEAFHSEMLGIVEIDADNRVAARFLFDLNDIDAAFEELDARYLAGEAAAYARTWSVISGFYAGFNRHELPATTPDWIYIDHRPLVTIEANDLSASMRAIVGSHAGHQHLHRGGASAERPRSCCHRGGVRELARGLQRRVANDRPVHGRRRPHQPRARSSTRRTWTPRWRGSTNSSGGRLHLRTSRPEPGRVQPTHSTAATWTVFLPS